MREIFNSTLLCFIAAVIVLCVISTDFIYADSKPGTSAYYSTVNSVADKVRESMVDRKKSVTVDYKVKASETSKSGWLSSLSKKIIKEAFKHTGVPEEGDSLKFCVKSYSSKASYYTASGHSFITLTFTFSYYTSASQEKKLSGKIGQMDLKGSSDYQTVRNIYNYICKNVKYNYKSDSIKYTAYNAAVNNSAVCQGYSVLFYRLALEYGIDSRVIAGKGRSDSHVWNIVKIGGKYYYLDCTWDAGENKYECFLKGYNDFDDHSRGSEYNSSSFKSSYPVSSSNYSGSSDKCSLKGPSGVKTNLTAYYGSTSGYDDIKVTWNKVSGAAGYYIKYRKVNSEKWNSKYTEKTYTYLKNLSDGYKYEIRVYPYDINKNKKRVSANYTVVKSVYTLKKIRVISKGKSEGGKILLTWSGISGESGYQVYRAKSEEGKYSKVATVKVNDKSKTTVNIKAAKGVSYWYKIRAYKAVDKDNYVYGPWSDAIRFKR